MKIQFYTIYSASNPGGQRVEPDPTGQWCMWHHAQAAMKADVERALVAVDDAFDQLTNVKGTHHTRQRLKRTRRFLEKLLER